jgi:hypothetical protein
MANADKAGQELERVTDFVQNQKVDAARAQQVNIAAFSL